MILVRRLREHQEAIQTNADGAESPRAFLRNHLSNVHHATRSDCTRIVISLRLMQGTSTTLGSRKSIELLEKSSLYLNDRNVTDFMVEISRKIGSVKLAWMQLQDPPFPKLPLMDILLHLQA